MHFRRWLRESRAEMLGMFTAPYEVPKLVAFNVAIVVIGYVVAAYFGWLKPHGLALLPAAIANWAFADVPATNLYGAQPSRALQVLDDRKGMTTLISVRNGALWLMVAPGVALLGFIFTSTGGQPMMSFLVGGLLLFLPLGFLGMVAPMAAAMPYHSMPWRERLARRDTWVRWGIGALSPFVLVAPAATILLAPGHALITAFGTGGAALGAVFVIVAGWSILLRQAGLRVALWVTERRREWLREFLADPSRG